MLNKFEQGLKLDQKSDKTIESYLKQVRPYLKFCNNKPTQETLYKFIIQKRDKGLKSSSINLFINAMQSFCEYNKIEMEFPKQKGAKKKIEPYWTEQQLNDDVIPMLNLIFNDGDVMENILKFMFYSGLRPEELCNLQKRDIDFNKKEIIVRNGKGDKDRIVPLTINSWLETFLKQQNDGSIFDVTYRVLGLRFTKIKRELNLDYKVTPYIMRRSFAKYCLINKKLDISIIQRLLGHESIETTMIYVQPDDQMVKDACAKIK